MYYIIKFIIKSLFHLDFASNSLETIRLLAQNKQQFSLFLDPQNKKILNNNPKNQIPSLSGFFSERLKTEPLKNFCRFSKRKSPSKSPLKIPMISIFLMTRMNWLIELKILFEKIQIESSHFVSLAELLNTIDEHVKDFVLIEERVYLSTHSEIGLSPSDIVDTLRKLNKKNISYDELFNLISQISHDSPKKHGLMFQKPLKSDSFLTDSSEKPKPLQLNQNSKPNSTENVRSSCEHIIETARFNKPEEPEKIIEEKESIKPKTPAKPKVIKQEHASSPLSFSMSAIQMTDSKTFTLSDFGGDFLNKNFNDSGKHLKASTSKSSSLTKILTYEARRNREEETVIRKKKVQNPLIEDNQNTLLTVWKKGTINYGDHEGVALHGINIEGFESEINQQNLGKTKVC